MNDLNKSVRTEGDAATVTAAGDGNGSSRGPSDRSINGELEGEPMSAIPVKAETEKAKGAAEAKDTVGRNWFLLLVRNWFLLLVILLLVVVVLLARCFSDPLTKVSIYGLGLVLAVAAAYRLWQPRKKLDEALKESHYEKFRRIEGLYRTMPDAVRARAENPDAVKEFESQLERLEEDAGKGVYEKFTRDDAPDLVHNLHLAFLQIATVDFLHFYIQSLESDYRRAVGPTAYDAYLAAVMRKPTDPPPSPEEPERILRAEATYLANETRRQQLLKQHVESTRQALLNATFRSWWWNIIPLLAVSFAFLVCLYWLREATANSESWTAKFAQSYLISHEPQNTANPNYSALFQTLIIAALLASAGIAGATGGLMSVIQRVQARVPESDATTDLWALSEAETAVFFAPVTGLIFAIVLSFLFAGGVLSGTVFPDIQHDHAWFFAIFNAKVFALWLLWAFLAGFSERLVPDGLDALAKQQSDLSSKSPSPASARSLAPKTQEQSQKDALPKPAS
jgi:hypothetical protein